MGGGGGAIYASVSGPGGGGENTPAYIARGSQIIRGPNTLGHRIKVRGASLLIIKTLLAKILTDYY